MIRRLFLPVLLASSCNDPGHMEKRSQGIGDDRRQTASAETGSDDAAGDEEAGAGGEAAFQLPDPLTNPLVAASARSSLVAGVVDGAECVASGLENQDLLLDYPQSGQILDFNGHYMFAFKASAGATEYRFTVYNQAEGECRFIKTVTGSEVGMNILQGETEHNAIRPGKLFLHAAAVVDGVEVATRIELELAFTDGGAEQTKPKLLAPRGGQVLPLRSPLRIKFIYDYPEGEPIGQLLGVKQGGTLVAELPYQEFAAGTSIPGEFYLTPSEMGLAAGEYELWIRMHLKSRTTGKEFWSDALIFTHTFSEASPLDPAVNDCGNLPAEASAFLALMRDHPGQGRNGMACDAVLQREAMQKAIELSLSQEFAHVLNGTGPNFRVQNSGMYDGDVDVYLLPGYYGGPANRSANYIESLGGGYASAADAFAGFLNSPAHRTHILGTNDFWAEQEDFGIGYVNNPNSNFRHYWVILTGRH